MGLAGLIPPATSQAINWEAIEVVPTSFVDPSLAAKEADILYSVDLNGEDAYVYVLLEHQSTQPKWMIARMHGYLSRIHERHLSMYPDAKELPVVVPVILYQGVEDWTRSTQYIDYFDQKAAKQEAFAGYIPDFKAEVISLPAMLEGDIKGDPYFEATLRLMKAIRERGAIENCLEAIETALSIICTEREDVEFVIAAYHYALHADDVDIGAIQGKFSDIQNTELKNVAMTAAQQLIEKGLNQGRQEDIIEALEIRFDSVPAGLQEAIRGIADDSKLRELHRSAIKCVSIEDFTKAL